MIESPGDVPEVQPQLDEFFDSYVERRANLVDMPYFEADGTFKAQGQTILEASRTKNELYAPDGLHWSTGEALIYTYLLAAEIFCGMFNQPPPASLPAPKRGQGYNFLSWGGTPALAE